MEDGGIHWALWYINLIPAPERQGQTRLVYIVSSTTVVLHRDTVSRGKKGYGMRSKTGRIVQDMKQCYGQIRGLCSQELLFHSLKANKCKHRKPPADSPAFPAPAPSPFPIGRRQTWTTLKEMTSSYLLKMLRLPCCLL